MLILFLHVRCFRFFPLLNELDLLSVKVGFIGEFLNVVLQFVLLSIFLQPTDVVFDCPLGLYQLQSQLLPHGLLLPNDQVVLTALLGEVDRPTPIFQFAYLVLVHLDPFVGVG